MSLPTSVDLQCRSQDQLEIKRGHNERKKLVDCLSYYSSDSIWAVGQNILEILFRCKVATYWSQHGENVLQPEKVISLF